MAFGWWDGHPQIITFSSVPDLDVLVLDGFEVRWTYERVDHERDQIEQLFADDDVAQLLVYLLAIDHLALLDLAE